MPLIKYGKEARPATALAGVAVVVVAAAVPLVPEPAEPLLVMAGMPATALPAVEGARGTVAAEVVTPARAPVLAEWPAAPVVAVSGTVAALNVVAPVAAAVDCVAAAGAADAGVAAVIALPTEVAGVLAEAIDVVDAAVSLAADFVLPTWPVERLCPAPAELAGSRPSS